jgi:hypothetical protein
MAYLPSSEWPVLTYAPGIPIFGGAHVFTSTSAKDRQDLLGRKSGRINTHYTRADLSNLIEAAEKVCETKTRKTPALTWLRRKAG